MSEMTQEQKDFETKYHFKVVKPRGEHYKIPIKEYIVTSALLNWEDDETTTIFAIKALDYTIENKHWITFKIAKDEFDKCINDFEIIRDGYEDYVKPKILYESLITYIGEEENDWLVYFSTYYENGSFVDGPPKTENLKFPKKEIKREICVGLNEYMFVYKSVYDLDKPSTYIFAIPPNLEYKEHVLQWVAPVRERILNNKIVYGQDLEFLKKNLSQEKFKNYEIEEIK